MCLVTPPSISLYYYTHLQINVAIKFNPCGEFRWSPEGPFSQIHTPHLHVGAPGIFSDLLRSVQVLKREWGVESNGKLPHLIIPSKMIPEFAVEDLPSIELQPWFLRLQWRTCPWAEVWWWWNIQSHWTQLVAYFCSCILSISNVNLFFCTVTWPYRDQVAQAARRWATDWTARVRSQMSEGVEIFLHSFVSRLVLWSTQPPIKWVPGTFPGGKGGRA